jgi:hypothetical protein
MSYFTNLEGERGRCLVMFLLRTVILAKPTAERHPLTNSLHSPILAATGHRPSLVPPVIFLIIGIIFVIGGIVAMRESRRGQNIQSEFSYGGCLCIIIGIITIGCVIAVLNAVAGGRG